MAALGFDAAVVQIREGNRDEDTGNQDGNEGSFHRVLRDNGRANLSLAFSFDKQEQSKASR